MGNTGGWAGAVGQEMRLERLPGQKEGLGHRGRGRVRKSLTDGAPRDPGAEQLARQSEYSALESHPKCKINIPDYKVMSVTDRIKTREGERNPSHRRIPGHTRGMPPCRHTLSTAPAPGLTTKEQNREENVALERPGNTTRMLARGRRPQRRNGRWLSLLSANGRGHFARSSDPRLLVEKPPHESDWRAFCRSPRQHSQGRSRSLNKKERLRSCSESDNAMCYPGLNPGQEEGLHGKMMKFK